MDLPGPPLLHPTGLPTLLNSLHLALQVGCVRLPGLVSINNLHDVGVAKALLLDLLGCPDAGQRDEGAFLEDKTRKTSEEAVYGIT